MSDLISRQAAVDVLDAYQVMVENGEENPYARARMRMCELPSAQAEIVRCGECKHYVVFKMGNKELPFPVCENFGMKMPSDEFYCAGGERREE